LNELTPARPSVAGRSPLAKQCFAKGLRDLRAQGAGL